MLKLSYILHFLFVRDGYFFKRQNEIRTHNHLVGKRTLRDLAKLATSQTRPVWLNGWVFLYELSGCGFESSGSYLTRVGWISHFLLLKDTNFLWLEPFTMLVNNTINIILIIPNIFYIMFPSLKIYKYLKYR